MPKNGPPKQEKDPFDDEDTISRSPDNFDDEETIPSYESLLMRVSSTDHNAVSATSRDLIEEALLAQLSLEDVVSKVPECPEGVFLPIYKKVQRLADELNMPPEEAEKMLESRYADQLPDGYCDEEKVRVAKSLLVLEEIMKAIPGSHFIFYKIRESLIKGTKLEKSHLEMGTMMMVDISGFTALMEKNALQGKIGVAKVYRKINSIFRRASLIASQYKGMALKYGGDALTVYFHGGEAEKQAKACALELQNMMAEIGKKDGPDALKLSIGLTTDKFYMGIIGEKERRDLVFGGKGIANMEKAEAEAGAGQILFMNAKGELEKVTEMPVVQKQLTTGLSADLKTYFDSLPDQDCETIAQAIDRFAGVMLSFAPNGTSDQLFHLDPDPEWTSGSTAVFIKLDGIDYNALDCASDELNNIYRISHKQATEYSGRIDKFGPSLLIRFSPLGEAEGSARRAYECARRILENVSQSSSVKLKIGIATGNMILGKFGARAEGRQYEYTVLGDPVNFAARLMAKAENGEILVTPEVYKNIEERIAISEQRKGRFKGKGGELPYFSVGGWKEIYGLDSAYYLESAHSIYGREEELGISKDIIEKVLNGQSQSLILEGDAGLGKTKLLKHILKMCYGKKFSIHGAAAEIESQKHPYGLWKDVVGNILDLDTAASDHDKIRQVNLILKLFNIDSQFTGPILSLLGLAGESYPENVTAEAVRVLFERLSAQKPIVIALEDLHWSDQESLNILEFLSRTIKDKRILFVGTTRPGECFEDLYDNHIDLKRLGPDDIREIAKDILTRQDTLLEPVDRNGFFSEQLTDHLYKASSGNPLFAEETVFALLRKNILKYGCFEPVKPLPADVGISQKLKSLIEGRIKYLVTQGVFTEDTLRVLYLLAVIGNNPPADLLEDLRDRNDVSRSGLEKELKHLTENRIIELQGGQLRFRHDKIREAIEEMLLPEKLIDLHGQAVEFFENSGDPDLSAERIFHHSHQILHGYGLDEAHNYIHLAQNNPQAQAYIERVYESARAVAESLANKPGSQRAIIAYCEDALMAAEHLGRSPWEKRELLLAIASQLTSTEAGEELKKAIGIYDQCLAISGQMPEVRDELIIRLEIIAKKMEPTINLAAYEPQPFYEMYERQMVILRALQRIFEPDDPVYLRQVLLAQRNLIFAKIYDAYQCRSDKERSYAVLKGILPLIDRTLEKVPESEPELMIWFKYLKARVYRDINEPEKSYRELDPVLRMYKEDSGRLNNDTLIKNLYVVTYDQCFVHGQSIQDEGLMDRAAELAMESLQFFRNGGAINAECLALEHLAHFANERGKWDECIKWAEKGYSKSKDYKLSGRSAIALSNLAFSYAKLHQTEEGRKYYDEFADLIPEVSQKNFQNVLLAVKKDLLDPFYA